MYYLMILIAAAFFSVQFVFNEKFKEETDSSWNSALKFTLYTSFFGLILLLITNSFQLKISIFSVVVAGVYGVINILLSYSSIKAFLYANLSVYSVFAMIGGMVLPVLFGVCVGEELTVAKIICCLFIAISILLTISGEKNSKKAIKYYIAVFILNGSVAVISKFHQMYPDINVDSGSFMILTKIISMLFCIILITISSQKSYKINVKAGVYSALYSVFNSLGNLILLIALLHLPASVQYPMVTGGTIVFSVIFSVLMKQKVTLKEYIGAAIACVATMFMVL